MIQTHIANPVDCRFDIFNGIPTLTIAIGDLRQFLGGNRRKLEKSSSVCLRSGDGNMLQSAGFAPVDNTGCQ